MHELRRRTGVRRLGVLASGWFAGQLVIGCSTILGIEPLEELGGAGGHAGVVAESRTDGGAGGGAGKAGAAAQGTNGNGDAGAGAQAGDRGTGGMTGADESNAARGGDPARPPAGMAGVGAHGGAAGKADSAGAAGQAGTGGGQAGAAGSPGVLSTVHGTVVDTRGRPVMAAKVQIGTQFTMTDASGAFSIDAVPETYDVGLLLVATVSAKPLRHVWIFEGLRRRDPTLQIYPGPGAYFKNVTVHTAEASAPLPTGQELYAAFGSPDTDFRGVALESTAVAQSSYWSGPEQTSGAVHALLVKNTEVGGAPTEILAHGVQPLTITSGMDAVDVTVSLAGPPVTFGMVSGSVTSHGGSLSTWFSLRWPDGTALGTALSGAGPNGQFSLIVPNIADASTAVVAMEGSIKDRPYAVGFIDGVVVGSSNYSIAIPEMPQPVAPAQGKSGVDATTSFEWLATGHVFVLHFIDKGTYDQVYLVTGKQKGNLPASSRVPYTAPANAQFIWRVEWHGDQASSITSVDDAAGPTGFLSAFWEDSLHGPKRGPGSYAVSEDRTFTTAP